MNLSQLIQFNTVRKKRRSLDNVQHSKTNKPAFPVKIGLLIHSATRKKSLINELANDGLSINYQRVMEIQEDITQYLCTKYNREALVCPPQLKQGLFTITSIDNIDHIPSSATASSSFHGTTISVFQNVTSEKCKDITLKLNTDINQEIFKTLPVYYTNIFPIKGVKPEYPINSKISSLFNRDANYSLDSTKAWLDTFTQKITKGDNSETQDISFSLFCSNLLKSNLNQLDINWVFVFLGPQPPGPIKFLSAVSDFLLVCVIKCSCAALITYNCEFSNHKY